MVAALVCLAAILATCPELWEREIVYTTDDVTNLTRPEVVYTEFASTSGYQLGYHWFLVSSFTFLPLVTLCVFNAILVSTVTRAAESRRQMMQLPVATTAAATAATAAAATDNRKGSNSRRSHQQRTITRVLVTVVLVFIVCQTPNAVLILYTSCTSTSAMSTADRNKLRIAGNLVNLCVQLNASLNFLLYAATSAKFRLVFLRMCSGRGRRLSEISADVTKGRGSTVSQTENVRMMSYVTSQVTVTGGRVARCRRSLREVGVSVDERDGEKRRWRRKTMDV